MKQPAPPKPKIINTPTTFSELRITPGDGIQVYLGPASPLLVTDEKLIPLAEVSLAYSWDAALKVYRFSMTRPICEKQPRLIERFRRSMHRLGAEMSIGLVLNGVREAPESVERRGIWLPKIDDLHEGLSSGSRAQVITDVVSGVCEPVQVWEAPPAFAINPLEY